MQYAITTMSTKGQIVVPVEMRKNIREGDKFLIIEEDGRLVLKNMKDIAADLKDDLRFAERIEKAWQRHDKGTFRTKSKKAFLEELRAF